MFFKLAAALAHSSSLAWMPNKDVGLKYGQRMLLYLRAIRPKQAAKSDCS
jgi:hypothetical protein